MIIATATVFLAASSSAAVSEPPDLECIAPAKPGGGYGLSCELVRQGMTITGQLAGKMRVTYLPGAIGAVAYNVMITQRPRDEGAITAFSSGTLLNLAQGKFGRYDESAVRWLASIGMDYGTVAVRADSPVKTLSGLIEELKRSPASLVLGAGGTVGSQDWMKAALVARKAGVDPLSIHYVSFEGGGETLSALLGGQIHAAFGDASEAAELMLSGKIRLLAVFAERRLPGQLSSVPTAAEQGHIIFWPVMRGFYMGPQVSDGAYSWWRDRLHSMLARREFSELRNQHYLLPLSLTGPELETRIHEQVAEYRALSREVGLIQ